MPSLRSVGGGTRIFLRKRLIGKLGIWRSRPRLAGRARKAVPSGTGLLRLSGVGYPRATSFLAFLAPAALPVIDQWTVKAIYGDQVWERQVETRRRLQTLHERTGKQCAPFSVMFDCASRGPDGDGHRDGV